MSNEAFRYVWEGRRGVYRVVTDSPEYIKETKKTVHHYVTVGKAFEKDGPIEFGPKYLALARARKDTVSGADNQGVLPKAKAVIPYGERLVLEKAFKETGLRKTMKAVFGIELTEQIMSLAFFMVSTGDALSCSAQWCNQRMLPSLDAPRISELLPKLDEQSCSSFFRRWIKENADSRTLCYDITSVSTYAKDMDIAEYGYNRDHEKWLRQINLALVTDKQNHIPLVFRIVNGSLSDVNTLKDTISDFRMYGASPYGLVMDRGFWSMEKLNILVQNNIHYMIPVPSSVAWARKLIEQNKSNVFQNSPVQGSDGEDTYCFTVFDPLQERRHVWAHIYYSPAIETVRKERFVKEYSARRQELLEGNADERYQKFYDEHFIISTRGRGGKRHVEDKVPLSDLMAGMNFGYWVLYTDMEKNAFIALNDYRDRNFIEAGFDDLKGATDAKRLRVHRTKSVYGRIFVQFIAQVMRTWMRNRISSFNDEVRKYAVSPDGVLTRVRSYSKVSYIGRYKSQFTVMTKGQRLLFQAFGIDAQADSDEESDSEKLLS